MTQRGELNEESLGFEVRGERIKSRQQFFFLKLPNSIQHPLYPQHACRELLRALHLKHRLEEQANERVTTRWEGSGLCGQRTGGNSPRGRLPAGGLLLLGAQGLFSVHQILYSLTRIAWCASAHNQRGQAGVGGTSVYQ